MGEYYTPDWLSAYMIREMLEDPMKRILDPSCGSGTFLVESIKSIKKQLKEIGKSNQNILEHLLNYVVGVDILPLAVIISKVNYMLALGELIQYKKKPISIPIFLADSVKLPEHERTMVASDKAKKILVPVYTIKTDGIRLQIPEKIAKSSETLSFILDEIKEILKDKKLNTKDVDIVLKSRIAHISIEERVVTVLGNLIKNIKDLLDQGRDTIWTYIIKNIYKPIFLRENKFDIIIGNPPWIAY